MYNKLLTIFLLCCFLLYGAGLRDADATAKGGDTASAQKPPLGQDLHAAILAGDVYPAEQPIYVSISEVFQDLKRPPVRFYHDRHARALGADGCEACHPRDAAGKIIYSFPIKENTRSAETLMNSYHNACIGCHNKRRIEGKSSGAVTCGECHAEVTGYHSIEYLPRMPEYYEPLRDTYHRDCIACHKDPAKTAHDATKLDWKSFYIRENYRLETSWPKVVMDYKLHYRHEQALERKCELCHLTPSGEEGIMVYVKGTESSCRDCHKDKDADNQLSYRHLSHDECIGCHLERHQEKKKAGPFYCSECHTGIESSTEELLYIPREERNQPQQVLIADAGERMQGVPFDHQLHELQTTTCQACHHDTLEKCSACHTQQGSLEGDWVPLAEAYHDRTSSWSCVGCHETKKQAPDCAGCHSQMKPELSESSCLTCHSGSLEAVSGFIPLPDTTLPDMEELSGELAFTLAGFTWLRLEMPKISAPEALLPDKTQEKLRVVLLEKSYDPSEFPHLKIIKKLTDISNNNKLSRYYHAEETTLCAGCHHLGPLEKKKTPPACSSCHTRKNVPEKQTPTLLGAYHRQCLGCHKAMGGEEKEKPQTCVGCHKEKPVAAAQAAAR